MINKSPLKDNLHLKHLYFLYLVGVSSKKSTLVRVKKGEVKGVIKTAMKFETDVTLCLESWFCCFAYSLCFETVLENYSEN